MKESEYGPLLQGRSRGVVCLSRRICVAGLLSDLRFAKDNPDMLREFDDDIKALKENGVTGKLLVKYALPESAAETGAPFLIE